MPLIWINCIFLKRGHNGLHGRIAASLVMVELAPDNVDVLMKLGKNNRQLCAGQVAGKK